MRRLFHLLLVIGAAILVVNPAPAAAADADNWQAGRIMDDSVFINKNSMSKDGIQNFLEAKDSVCLVNYRTAEPLGNNQYGAKKSAAYAIWKSAQLFDINPRVLLVTLQKE